MGIDNDQLNSFEFNIESFKITSIMFRVSVLLAFFLLCGSCVLHKKKVSFRSEKAFTVYLKDSIPMSVDLMFDDSNKPLKYYAHIFAPVCEEKICYPLVVDVSWDLLGNFDEYSLPIDSPLTKFDHEVFNKEDVDKMHKILSDKSSVLKFYSSQDLVDSSETKKSSVVDAITGATNKTLQSSIVSGAVHSSYLLWHIVNGSAADSILQHTESLLNDSMLTQMLESNNYHYQYYALGKIPKDRISDFLPAVIRLVGTGKEYVPYFAIEKIPEEAWMSSETQQSILNLLNQVDFKIQNQVINKLKDKRLTEAALDKLISNFRILQPSQIIKSLDIIITNKDILNYNLLLKLAFLLGNPSAELTEKVYDVLKSQSKNFPDLEKITEKYKKGTSSTQEEK